MSHSTWPGIRPGACRFNIDNEANIVYLFDEGNTDRLRNSGANFHDGFLRNEADVDGNLKKLAKEGWFVAYELNQDDDVCIEVVVGKPLSKKELATARWHPPQKAFLRVPSGRLRIDTANTLEIHESENRSEPGIVSIPPGDYTLTLHRANWTEMQNDGLIAEGQTWMGPQEIVVLTPATAKTSPRNKLFLPFPQPKDAIWKGRYEFAGRAFRGLAMTDYWWSNIDVNLDRVAEAQLGLKPGDLFRVAVENIVFDVLFYGDADIALTANLDWVTWAKSIAGSRPEFGVCYRFREFPQHEHSVTITRDVSTTKFPIHSKWLPAEVTRLTEKIDIPPQYTK